MYRGIGTLLHANSAHLARARDRSRAPDGWARGRATRASKRACNQQGLVYTARASRLHASGAQIGPGEASGRASSRAPANAQLAPPPPDCSSCQALPHHITHRACGLGMCSNSSPGLLAAPPLEQHPPRCEPTAAQAGPQRSPSSPLWEALLLERAVDETYPWMTISTSSGSPWRGRMRRKCVGTAGAASPERQIASVRRVRLNGLDGFWHEAPICCRGAAGPRLGRLFGVPF